MNLTSRGFALLTTLLLITLLTAVVAQLVTMTSGEAVISVRRQNTLAHELARDSAGWVLADRLDPENSTSASLIRDLDMTGQATVEFDIGSVGVSAVITDDGAKLNPNLWPRPDQKPMLNRKLRLLVRAIRRPEKIDLQPMPYKDSEEMAVSYVSFDQLLSIEDPLGLFRWDSGEAVVWSDLLTLWGDGRLNLQRVSREVLEAVLEDIRPNLAESMLSKRPADRSLDFTAEALNTVDSEIRSRVQERLSFGSSRYAITLTTAIHADRRRWYLVGRLTDGRWELLNRSAMTW